MYTSIVQVPAVFTINKKACGIPKNETWQPQNLAIDITNGLLYVGEWESREIKVFNLEDGEYLKDIVPQGIVHGITASSEALYVAVLEQFTDSKCCGLQARILEHCNVHIIPIDPSLPVKTFRHQTVAQSSPQYWLGLTSEGNIIVSDRRGRSVYLYYPDGSFMTAILGGLHCPDLKEPRMVCAGKKDDILVIDRVISAIKIFDKNGKYKRTIGSRGQAAGLFGRPDGVFVDHQLHILVSDNDKNQIQVYNYEGPLISTIKGEAGLTEPTGIVTDDQGHCYICYPQQQCVKKYLYTNAAPPETPKMISQMSMTSMMSSNGRGRIVTDQNPQQLQQQHSSHKMERQETKPGPI